MMYLVFCMTEGRFREIRNEFDFETIDYRESQMLLKGFEKEGSPKLLLTFHGTVRLLDLEDIQYMAVDGRIVSVYLEGSEEAAKSYAQLVSLERTLGENGFVRISRFFLVSVSHVAAVRENEIELRSGKKLAVGRAYRKKLKKALEKKYKTHRVL